MIESVRRLGLTVAVVLVGACADDAGPASVDVEEPIELTSGDYVVIPPDEARMYVGAGFVAAIHELDPDGLRRALCDTYASDAEVDRMIERNGEFDTTERFSEIDFISDIADAEYLVPLTLGPESGVLTIRVTNSGVKCIDSISADNPALEHYLVPGSP